MREATRPQGRAQRGACRDGGGQGKQNRLPPAWPSLPLGICLAADPTLKHPNPERGGRRVPQLLPRGLLLASRPGSAAGGKNGVFRKEQKSFCSDPVPQQSCPQRQPQNTAGTRQRRKPRQLRCCKTQGRSRSPALLPLPLSELFGLLLLAGGAQPGSVPLGKARDIRLLLY